MLLCLHAGWGLQRRGGAAKEGAERGRGVSRLEKPGGQTRQPATLSRPPYGVSAPSASTGYRGHEAVGAKTRTATAKTLTKAFGSPVMIREVGGRDTTTLGFLWRILAGFFVTLTMKVAWRMLPCEAGAFWPRPVFWSRRGSCRAPDGLPARVGTTPTRRAHPTPTIGRTWSGRGRCWGLRSNAPAGPARSGRAYCAPEDLRCPDVPWGEKKT
jgi:hypothetical protein